MGLSSLVDTILEDGHIEESEVEDLRAEIYGEHGDGGTDVTQNELREVWRAKDEAESYCTAFGDFVVQAAVDCVLGDSTTPGSVDADEAALLNELIGADGMTDEIEERVLVAVRQRATSVHPTLMG